MENSNKRKWQIRGAVLAIFVLGFVAGALTITAYHAGRGQRVSDGRRDRYEQMLDRLHLTTEQRTQVEQILKDSRTQVINIRKESAPRFEEVRQQTDERLQAVFTPQQWDQWRQMANEMRGRRRGPRPQQ